MNVLCLVPEEVCLAYGDREGDSVGQGQRICRGTDQVRPEGSTGGVIVLEAVGDDRASSSVCTRQGRPLRHKLRLR